MQQTRNLRLIGLQLRIGAPNRGVFIRRVFKLDQAQRQPVDEHHNIRPTIMLRLNDGELIHRQPIIVHSVREIQQPHMIARDTAISARVFHRHAITQHAVKGAVGLRQ